MAPRKLVEVNIFGDIDEAFCEMRKTKKGGIKKSRKSSAENIKTKSAVQEIVKDLKSPQESQKLVKKVDSSALKVMKSSADSLISSEILEMVSKLKSKVDQSIQRKIDTVPQKTISQPSRKLWEIDLFQDVPLMEDQRKPKSKDLVPKIESPKVIIESPNEKIETQKEKDSQTEKTTAQQQKTDFKKQTDSTKHLMNSTPQMTTSNNLKKLPERILKTHPLLKISRSTKPKIRPVQFPLSLLINSFDTKVYYDEEDKDNFSDPTKHTTDSTKQLMHSAAQMTKFKNLKKLRKVDTVPQVTVSQPSRKLCEIDLLQDVPLMENQMKRKWKDSTPKTESPKEIIESPNEKIESPKEKNSQTEKTTAQQQQIDLKKQTDSTNQLMNSTPQMTTSNNLKKLPERNFKTHPLLKKSRSTKPKIRPAQFPLSLLISSSNDENVVQEKIRRSGVAKGILIKL